MIPEAVLAKHSGRFRWGSNDCVHFCADWIEHETGHRPSLPSYQSEAEAKQALGDGTLEDAVRAELGEPVEPIQAEYGDVVLSSFDQIGQVVGIADPDSEMGIPIFWLRAETGVIPVDLNLAIKVFRCRPL